jgi:hypothetical protein
VAPFARVLLVFLPLAAATFAAFWLGVVPRTLSPLSPLSLEKRDQWFIDLKLAGLRLDPVLCQSVLKQPYVGATPVQDTPPTNGCGWINSVRFSEIGGANMSVQPLTCEMTAALTLWVTHEVQAAAKAYSAALLQESITWELTAAATSRVSTGGASTVGERDRYLRLHSQGRPEDFRPTSLARQRARGKVSSPSASRSVPLFPCHPWTKLQHGSRRPFSLRPRGCLGLQIGCIAVIELTPKCAGAAREQLLGSGR